MDEQTVIAESSSAPVVESFEIPRSGTSDYADWRVSGKLPEAKPKTEEAASSTVEETTQTKQQETAPPKPKAKTAEQRIAELESTIEKIRKGANLETKKPESSSASDPKPAAPQHTRPKPTSEDKTADGKPKYSTYEDFVEELADWKAEQREAARDKEALNRSETESFKKKVDEARNRNEGFDQVMNDAMPILSGADIPHEIKARLNDSEVLPDLIFTIGGDAAQLAEFTHMAKTNPAKAREYIAVVEHFISEELAKAAIVPRDAPAKGADGKFVKAEPVTPAKRGPESSPEPPIEIGSRGSGAMDESARALSAIERGDGNSVRAWMKAENAKDLRRRRGV